MGGGKGWGFDRTSNIKTADVKTCKNVKGTQSFLEFLKAHNQVTTILKDEILKHADFSSE